MASSTSAKRQVLAGVLVLVGLLVLGGGIMYVATDHGKKLMPSLEQPSLNISNITREKIMGQLVVQLRNHTPIELKIDSLRYETRVDGKRLAQGHKDRPLVVQKNATRGLSLPLSL